jgi:hypothetical protein
MVGGLILAYVDRHLVPATMTNWDFSDVFWDVVNMAIPVTGFILASRRPQNGRWTRGSTGPAMTPTRWWPRSLPG